jgi:hypothetical protein|tara:strand:+ start:3190 stop:3351 length:162 start_codon:yes stop_codon:yes gene_type:complete
MDKTLLTVIAISLVCINIQLVIQTLVLPAQAGIDGATINVRQVGSWNHSVENY